MEQTKKIYQQKVNNYYRVVLEMMSFIKPFSDMRPRQKDVYAELLKVHEKYQNYPVKERNKLIFDKDTYNDIATKLETTKEVVTNVLSELRNLGFIVKEEGIEIINSKRLLPRVDLIGFNFIEE